ncbi:MAG: glucose 1-dehydrogenase [Conexivisphaera sp.]
MHDSRDTARSAVGRLEGRVALVTGASRGIGRAVAEALALEGARVAVNYRGNRAVAEELASRIGGIAVGADVSRRDEVRSMVRKVESELGPISVLVNNAGIMEMMSVEEFDEASFRRMMDVNLMGTIYTTLEALEDLKSTRGVVVNMASNAGIGTAIPGSTFYAVSKAAVMALTRRLAFELAPHGIRVNAVAPGWVETDMTVGGRSPEDAEAVRSFFRSRSMLRMTGVPGHVASAVLFLASPESAYMTGQVLVVDGGRIDYITHGI